MRIVNKPKLKRCSVCGKMIRPWNQSGLCSSHNSYYSRINKEKGNI